MYRPLLATAATAALLVPLAAFPASDSEIAELRSMLDQMKTQYERRIQDLESRLAKAERQSADTARAPAESQPMTAPGVGPVAAAPARQIASGLGALTSGSAFNPQLSVILDGNYYHDGIDGEGAALVGQAFQPSGGGHAHEHEGEAGHSHGSTVNGFNFREAELAFSATVDPYFDAAAYIAIDGDGNVHLEEG